MNAIITVVGADTVGIVAKVTAFLASRNINIEEISQTIMSGIFVMVMLVKLFQDDNDLETLKRDLAETGKSMGLTVSIMHEGVFSAMHRL